MRLAAYNLENLFDRAKAMNLDSWEEGKPILEAFAKLNSLLGEITYSAANKRKMVELMIELGLEKSDKGPFVILRRNHGGLVKRPRAGDLEIIADGRADWVGSLELLDEPVDENAMRNTARVLADLEADVVMVIDGNDERGIDVGLLCREGFAIETMRSHVDDRMANGIEVFSRDCPEYHLTTPNGNRLIVMVNHFKSKGYGTVAGSNARRKAQAQRVKEIYEGLIAQGAQFIAVAGDLNDTPDSEFVSRNGTCMRNSRTSVMPLPITLPSGWMLIFSFASARVWLDKGDDQNFARGLHESASICDMPSKAAHHSGARVLLIDQDLDDLIGE
jgi:hypothetical protein